MTSAPDLVVRPPTVSRNRLLAGESFTLHVSVRNQGGSASPETEVHFYRAQSARISTSDVPLGSARVPALSANAEIARRITAYAPAVGGTYYYGACVVRLGDETDVSNNCSSGAAVRVFDRFTDHPIIPGRTPIKAIHFRELRVRIAALRSGAGLPTPQWTDPTLFAGLTPVRRVHLMELRRALDAVYDALGRPRPRYTDVTVRRGVSVIEAEHVMDLRRAIVAVE